MFLITKEKNKSLKQLPKAQFQANLNRNFTLRRISFKNRTTPFISRLSPSSSTIRQLTKIIATNNQLKTPAISKAISTNRTTSFSKQANISKTKTNISSNKLRPTNIRNRSPTNTKLSKINMKLSKLSIKLRLQLLSMLSLAIQHLPTLKEILPNR
jgi:hypothetical protein